MRRQRVDSPQRHGRTVVPIVPPFSSLDRTVATTVPQKKLYGRRNVFHRRSPLPSRHCRLFCEQLEGRRLLALTISEIHIEVLGSGNPEEDQYVEFRGTPGEVIPSGTYLVVIEGVDSTSIAGSIDSVFDLSGITVGSNGYLVLLEKNGSYQTDLNATVLKSTQPGFSGLPNGMFRDETANHIIPGADTFLLITAPNAPPHFDPDGTDSVDPSDVDSDNDGVLDGVATSWTILDGVSVLNGPFPSAISYAPITFSNIQANAPPGSTVVDMGEGISYVARIGESTGFSRQDWVGGETIERSNNTFRFRLHRTEDGHPEPQVYTGRDLDHVGSRNFSSAISGRVFADDDGDGVQGATETGMPGIAVFAGDSLEFGASVAADDFQQFADLTNVAPYATLTTADFGNNMLSQNVSVVEPNGQRFFAGGNNPAFSSQQKLRIDFYLPAKSVSIDTIGSLEAFGSAVAYGTLEAFNSAGHSIGFVRSQALENLEVERLTIERDTADIAWAVAYSDETHLDSSPFGMLDNLSFTMPTNGAITDANGDFTIDLLPAGSYNIRQTIPSNKKQSTPPDPPGAHSLTISGEEHVHDIIFGNRGNLHPSISDQSFGTFEDAPGGTFVGDVLASDIDAEQTLTFSITGGSGQTRFTIDTATGRLEVADGAVLNFEESSSWTLIVNVVDDQVPPLDRSATITVDISDLNESPTIPDQSFDIPENLDNGAVVGTVVAIDPDGGAAGELTFRIADGNVDDAFEIDQSTGQLTVANSSAVNFESTQEFNLLIRATDIGNPAKTTTNTVPVRLQNINEEPIITTTRVDVPENALLDALVGSIDVNDQDAGESFTFILHSGNESGAFSLNITNGGIRVLDPSQLNFEVNSLFTWDVEVQDAGALSDRITVEIRIIDLNESPTAQSESFTLDENRPIGTVVGQVTAADPDNDQELTYAIVGGTGQEFVAIDNMTGEITVSDPTGLNFEVHTELALDVEVTDNGAPALTASAAIVVHLNDLDEPPVIEPQEFSILENSAVGQVVGSVTAFDHDFGDSVTYEIVGGSGETAFAIDSTTGELTVSDSAALDREAVENLTVEVQVSDQSNQNSTATVTIHLLDQNEFVHEILTSSLTIAENSAANTSVGAVVISDEDATHFFAFALTSGNVDNAFAIDSLSGTITVQSPTALNTESRQSYELTVKVSDSLQPASQVSATITIQISDVNEFAPIIADQSFTIDENLAVDALVGIVTGTDDDSLQELRYSITDGNLGDAFNIDSETGEIRVNSAGALDFEVTETFTLQVQATDNGEPALSDLATVTIHLSDQNEFNPIIPAQTFSIEELSPFSTLVGTVVASDQDGSHSLQFAIVNGNTGEAFSIVSATGELRVSQTVALDFETSPTFILTISATDNGQPARTGTGTVTVNLTDLNEFPPTIESASFTIAENPPADTVVGAVSASDLDSDQTLTFAITAGNSGDVFSIDSATGEIRVQESSALDFEQGTTWALAVSATDSGEPALSGTATVSISLTDVNEFDPVVADATFTLLENPLTGDFVGNMSASDADTSQSVTFSIVAGIPENAMSIDATSGQIRVEDPAAFDFETIQTLTITVLATDNGQPDRTSTAEVTVQLQDENEFTPILDVTPFSVAENSASNTLVGTVTAHDLDSSQTITFSIVDDNLDSAFSIDATLGELRVVNSLALNHETRSSYELQLQVTDNGSPTRSSTSIVSIQVTNVNELPSAVAGGPYTIDAGTSLHLDAAASSDVDVGDVLQFKWDFDLDGTIDLTTSDAAPSVAWSRLTELGLHPGEFEIGLDVVDQSGLTAHSSADLTITDTFTVTQNDDDQQHFTLSLFEGKVQVHAGTVLVNEIPLDDINKVKIIGSDADNSLTVDYRNGNPIPPGGLEFDGGGGQDTFVIGGSDVHLDLTDPTGPQFSNIERLNIIGNSPNTLTLDLDSVLDVTDDENTLTVLSDNDETVNLGTGWRITGTASEDSVFVRILQQGSATIHLAGPWDWHNPVVAFDVNANGSVEPQDVLVAINELNSPRFSQPNRQLVPAAGLATFPNFYYDAKPDGFIVPLDALTIINFLNNRALGEGEGGDLVRADVSQDADSGPLPLIFSESNGSRLRMIGERGGAATVRPAPIHFVQPARNFVQPARNSELQATRESPSNRVKRPIREPDPKLIEAVDEIFAELASGSFESPSDSNGDS